MNFPLFLYHETDAPQGRKFTDPSELPESSEGWVDTPAKFTGKKPSDTASATSDLQAENEALKAKLAELEAAGDKKKKKAE